MVAFLPIDWIRRPSLKFQFPPLKDDSAETLMTPILSMLSSPFARQALCLLTGVVVLAGFSLFLPAFGRGLPVDTLASAFNLVAAWLLYRRCREGGATRLFFLLVALALAIHGFSSTLRLLADHGLPWLHLGRTEAFIVGLACPILQGVAVLCWPTSQPGRALRWREFLDALLFTSALLLVFWLLGLGELFSGASFSFQQKTMQLVILLDYALLMGLALYRGLNAPGRFTTSLGWLLLVFLVISAGNLTWLALFLRGQYYPGHPLEALALVIPALYLLVARAPLPGSQSTESRALRLSGLFLPYLPLLLALPLAIHRIPHQALPRDSVALWLGLGMVGLLLLRQLVALWDSHTFTRSLEIQVQQRTLALEESQAMLLRTQRMNLLATLGAGVAHDLNNLLSVVLMTTDLMEEDTEAGQPPARRDLDALRKASIQAGELVKKLMAFGQRGESRPRVFDLRAQVEGMAKLLEKLATVSVRVRWELGTVPLFLEMDPVQIEQILVNLVANARDAMPKGGILRVRAERCDGPGGPQALLSITDSGTGIPEEHLGRLFDAFFTTKEPGRGTGLGLASVKAIVDECGAKISVESQVGVGTTFTLRFPLATAERA